MQHFGKIALFASSRIQREEWQHTNIDEINGSKTAENS